MSLLYELRSMLREMEHDIGLEDLSQSELDVLLAAHAVSDDPGGAVTSEQIRGHKMAAGLARATFHRALKSLVSMGLLSRPDGSKAGQYIVSDNLMQRE